MQIEVEEHSKQIRITFYIKYKLFCHTVLHIAQARMRCTSSLWQIAFKLWYHHFCSIMTYLVLTPSKEYSRNVNLTTSTATVGLLHS